MRRPLIVAALALASCRDTSRLAPPAAGSGSGPATAGDARFVLAPISVGTTCTLTSQLTVTETPAGRAPNVDLEVEQTVDVLEVGLAPPALPTRLRVAFPRVVRDGVVLTALPRAVAYDVRMVQDRAQVQRMVGPIAVSERVMFQQAFIPLLTVFDRMFAGRAWTVDRPEDVQLAAGPPEIRGTATLRTLTPERATFELVGRNQVGDATTTYTGTVTIDRATGLAIDATLGSRSTGTPGGVPSVLEQRQHQTKACTPPA
jgi:hypothetical protein